MSESFGAASRSARAGRPAEAGGPAAGARRRSSLKWRLVGLFLLLACATTVTFLVGMRQLMAGGWEIYARPIVGDYVDRLAAEIGTPPSVARARALAARLPIAIRIEGPQVQWQSHPAGGRRRGAWGGGWAWDRGAGGERSLADADEWHTRQLADGHRVVFGLAGSPIGPRTRGIGWITLAALLAFTGAAYLIVRRLLSPLDDIRAGALRYGRGEFGQPIVARRRDELGELSSQINTMAERLHGMLEAKRGLLLAISHELRSPLTRARVNAELVEEGAPRDALLRDLAEMRDLITDLLESERLAGGHSALQAERCDLNALVREVSQGRAVALQLAADLAPQSLDPVRIRLLLRNLIDNALRHSAGATEPPRVSTQRDAAGVRIVVRDFGPGVAAEHLAHLAEPFYRADASRQRATGGFGLGLHLCRLVAQAHGGTLHLANAAPGFEATVDLPAPPAA